MTTNSDFLAGTTFKHVKNDRGCAHDHTTLKAALRCSDYSLVFFGGPESGETRDGVFAYPGQIYVDRSEIE